MSMSSTALEVFRLLAPEFVNVIDKQVELWLELTRPMVSRKKFGDLYEQALALLTAHRMSLSGIGAETSDEDGINISGISAKDRMSIASVSEGSVSISFSNGGSQMTMNDADLALTSYGVQYLSIRRLKIISITSAGQD